VSKPFRCNNIRLFDIEPVTLDVGAGQTLCITGPSGCGKSLLLRALADLLPHQGEASFDARPADEFTPESWRKTVGFLAAESQWWFDNVADHFPRGMHQSAKEMICQLGLDSHALDWQVRRCSTGEKQRLALVRLLVREPKVLLLDEPTANVDATAMTQIEKLIKTYQLQTQCPVVWVSHDDEQVKRVADEVFHCQKQPVVTA